MRSTRSLLLSAALLFAAGCGDDDDTTIPYVDDGKLTVMTRNLYLGADLTPAIVAPNQAAFLAATTAVWNSVNANDFEQRAVALADEIEAALPDVVGLQEVTRWRTQLPGDVARGNSAPNATVDAFDYLAILLRELSGRGLVYVPAVEEELFDVEVPISSGQMDVRLTDRQVILVRQGVTLSATDSESGEFETLLPLPLAGTELPVKRGWTKVEVTVGGEDVTVYNTHLEAFNATVRVAQANELVALLAAETGRVVLVGDLNSDPGAEGHLAMTEAGFTDPWTGGDGTGLTCCFAPILTSTEVPLAQRIDYVLLRPGDGTLTAESVTVVGEDAADRTASGLWPSDHAGVVATIAP